MDKKIINCVSAKALAYLENLQTHVIVIEKQTNKKVVTDAVKNPDGCCLHNVWSSDKAVADT